MTKRSYKFIDGEVVEILGLDAGAEQSAAVHQDTLSTPLRDPVTGKMYDSKSKLLEAYAARGSRVVGNDWANSSMKPEDCRPKDKITDAKMQDAIRKAEAVHSDPAKRRAWKNEQIKRAEHAQRFMRQGRV